MATEIQLKPLFFQLLHYDHGVDQWQPKILIGWVAIKPWSTPFFSLIDVLQPGYGSL